MFDKKMLFSEELHAKSLKIAPAFNTAPGVDEVPAPAGQVPNTGIPG